MSEEGRKRPLIVPIFIPYHGCPHRCIYCQQEKITAQTTRQPEPSDIKEILEEALKSDKVAAAALDVYSTEPPLCHSLIGQNKVICTPHLGASTKEAQVNVAVDAANQIVAALKDGKIKNCVNGVRKIS